MHLPKKKTSGAAIIAHSFSVVFVGSKRGRAPFIANFPDFNLMPAYSKIVTKGYWEGDFAESSGLWRLGRGLRV